MISRKLKYLAWAALHQFTEHSCPSCQSAQKKIFLKRKYVVTTLLECPGCGLRYRVPKMSEEQSNLFYQEDYAQGFTTEMPGPSDLRRLKEAGFRGSEQDYTIYLRIMREAGVTLTSSVLDFGCSWGYGTWQLTKAGYDVYGYEVSRPRAEYAARELGCRMIPDPSEVTGITCLFSAHVVEHLPNPCSLWRLASKILSPGGKMVLFTPNGDDTGNPNYHQLWGLVHPCVLTTRWMDWAAHTYGFRGSRCLSQHHTELAYIATKT